MSIQPVFQNVSTHSRPKAAEKVEGIGSDDTEVSTHSRPKAAETFPIPNRISSNGRFQHTAARRRLIENVLCGFQQCFVSTHSRPKAAEFSVGTPYVARWLFQHTAARRRLNSEHQMSVWSTPSFNTQPPEGG